MPARVWRHSVHSILEVLRYRRPESQDFMVTFVNYADQMISLLLETLRVFTGIWTEVLGDLGRYRMAIEEDKEILATWKSTIAGWYKSTLDK